MNVRPSLSHTHKRRNVWIISTIVLILIIAGVITALVYRNINDNPTTPSEQVENNNKKASTIENNGQPVKNGTNDSTHSGTYTPPSNNAGITIAASQSNGSVVVTTRLVGYADGTCTLTVTNGTQTTTQTADVIYAADYSSCAGFSIPVNTLGGGVWNIMLSVLSGGNTTSKSTTFEVSS